jgi:hypothetical protein
MPETYVHTARAWGRNAVAHLRAVGCRELLLDAYHENVGGPEEHRVGCPACNIWFVITVQDLAQDPDSGARLMERVIRTPQGRLQIIQVLTHAAPRSQLVEELHSAYRRRVELGPALRGVLGGTPDGPAGVATTEFGWEPLPEPPPRTAWERLLDDDGPV